MPTSTVNWLWIGNIPPIDATPSSNVTSAELTAAGMNGYSVSGPAEIAPVAVTGDTFTAAGITTPVFAAPFNPVSGNVSQFSFDSPTTTGVVTGQTITAAFRADLTIVLPDGSTTSQVATVLQMSNGDMFLRPNPNFLAAWDGINSLRTITINTATPFAQNTVFNSIISFSPEIFDIVIPCFVAGTRIQTETGDVPVEWLRPGVRVMTADRGLVPVAWVGQMRVTAAECATDADLMPVRIKVGALGGGLPKRELLLSGQHRVLVRSRIAERMFEAEEVLVAAKHLVGMPGITAATDAGDLTYVHFLCNRHEVVMAEGAPCESLYPGPMALRALPPASVAEILTLFPELAGFDSPLLVPARPFVRGKQGRTMAERHQKNGIALLAA